MYTLEVKNISKQIGKKEIIKDVSIKLNNKEVVGLLGPNGAGKTTSFYMICGLIKPTSGAIFLNGEDITNDTLSQRALKGISYLPQESSIFKDLNVRDNLLLAAEIKYKDKSKQISKVNELLEIFNITHIASSYGYSLSGGERRRCEIARSLVIEPQFLLLDEPFAGVDPIAVADIQNIIRELNKLEIGILITDHNVRETLQICENAYVIKSGSILDYGTSDEISKSEIVRKNYLGDNFKLWVIRLGIKTKSICSW